MNWLESEFNGDSLNWSECEFNGDSLNWPERVNLMVIAFLRE